MKRLINIFVLILLVSAFKYSFADENTQRYVDIFYPSGMIEKQGYHGKGITEYNFYDEKDLNETLKIVLVSEMVNVFGEDEDNKYTVWIAFLAKNEQGAYEIKNKIDVTDKLTLTMENLPGYFMAMGGCMNYFKISSTDEGLHLNLGNTLSGTGAISSTSDIFYLINKTNFTLTPVIDFLDNSQGGKSGDQVSFIETFFYTDDIDLDDTTEILTQKFQYEDNPEENIKINSLSSTLDVYSYNKQEKKYKFLKQISELPATAQKLKRDQEPDINELLKEDCCPES